MAKEQQSNAQQQTRKTQSGGQNANAANRKGTPMIVERVAKLPVVSFAVSMGFSQYDKLKASNVTVGDCLARAEGLALFLWEKVQPIVEKLQDPINKADQLACNTMDFVENKLHALHLTSTQHQSATEQAK